MLDDLTLWRLCRIQKFSVKRVANAVDGVFDIGTCGIMERIGHVARDIRKREAHVSISLHACGAME